MVLPLPFAPTRPIRSGPRITSSSTVATDAARRAPRCRAGRCGSLASSRTWASAAASSSRAASRRCSCPVRSLPADTCASSLARVHDDLRLALVGVAGVGVADAAGDLRLGLGQLAPLAADVGLGDPQQPLARCPARPRAAPRTPRAGHRTADGARAELGGAVHAARGARGRGSPRAAHPTTARRRRTAARVRRGPGCWSARRAASPGGAAQAGRPARSAPPRRPTASPTRRSRSVGSPTRASAAMRAFLDVPVVADVGDRGRVARLDRAQRRRCAATPSRSATVRSASRATVCGEVADRPGDAHRARRGPQLTGDQAQQGGLPRAVGADQPGAACAERDVEAGEHAVAVGPGEGQLGTDDGGSRHRTPHGSTTAGPRCQLSTHQP